jgi:hypothetical protein
MRNGKGVANATDSLLNGMKTSRWDASTVMAWTGRALASAKPGRRYLAPLIAVNLALEQCRCEPLADGEVHAQKPMEWALDAHGEPYEPVNLHHPKDKERGLL